VTSNRVCAATASDGVSKLRWLDRYLRDKDLVAVNRTTVDRVTREKLAEGWSNATVNRTLEVLRAVLRKCVNEWEWLDRHRMYVCSRSRPAELGF
jgi:hypothetical protein